MTIRNYSDDHLESEIAKTNLYLQGNYSDEGNEILIKYYEQLMEEMNKRTTQQTFLTKLTKFFKG